VNIASVFLSCVLTLLTACQSVHLPIPQAATPQEASLQDFLLQSVKENSRKDKDNKREDNKHKKPPKLSERDWKNFKPRSGCERAPELLITDILLTSTGERIMGPNALAALTPDYAGTDISLTVQTFIGVLS
jgi:hemolysin activation/secretion protein